LDTQEMAALGARLKQAREQLALSQKEVAARMGFPSHQTIIAIERGERAVKALELSKFARLYARTVESLLLGEETTSRPAVAWRDRGNDADARLVEQRFLTYCEEYAGLEMLAEGKPTNFDLACAVKINDYDDAVRLGESLGRQLELGSHPAREMATVIEEHGVKVFVHDAGDAGSAAATRGGFGAGIMINERNAPWRVNYDIAHELFHLLTWEQLPCDAEPAPNGERALCDKFANAFAQALLLPANSVRSEFEGHIRDHKLSYIDCVNMARDFGVSTAALLYRLENLRLLPRGSAKAAVGSPELKDVDRTVRKTDTRELPVGVPSRRFVAVAFKCLQAGRLSRSRFAELVNVGLHEVNAFLAERGYDVDREYAGEISTA